MSLKKGSKVSRGYSTVAEEDGVNYRDIAETMTELGFTMNHSSARNYVLRVMKKFVVAIVDEYECAGVNESKLTEISKSPQFQHSIADILHSIETERRSKRQHTYI